MGRLLPEPIRPSQMQSYEYSRNGFDPPAGRARNDRRRVLAAQRGTAEKIAETRPAGAVVFVILPLLLDAQIRTLMTTVSCHEGEQSIASDAHLRRMRKAGVSRRRPREREES